MGLISDLPDDLTRDCLIRITYQQFKAVASATKAWKAETEKPEFHRLRKLTGHTQQLFAMVQSNIDSTQNDNLLKRSLSTPTYRITICEPETGNWSELPPVPDSTNGLPMFCRVVSIGFELVVLGGWDPKSWKVSRSVYVYNFLTGTWRRGIDIPGESRSFFGCTSDSNRTVYIAGGHDCEKNALRSAIAYDVVRDEWTNLSDMARERDECTAVFQCGKLHVIGGYSTETQGRFERSAEVYDVAKKQWEDLKDDFLESATCPRTCVGGDDMEMYMCVGADVVVKKDATWRKVAKLPVDVRNVAFVMTWQGKLLVIGSVGFGEANVAYIFDLKKFNWVKLSSAYEFTGHVQSGCYIEI